jgi:hypothetical protein
VLSSHSSILKQIMVFSDENSDSMRNIVIFHLVEGEALFYLNQPRDERQTNKDSLPKKRK